MAHSEGMEECNLVLDGARIFDNDGGKEIDQLRKSRYVEIVLPYDVAESLKHTLCALGREVPVEVDKRIIRAALCSIKGVLDDADERELENQRRERLHSNG